jgi:hypothetical protein
VQLLETLLPVFPEMACDPFGNYVVQCVLEHSERPLAAKYVSERFPGKFLKLACNKFASNVMEKILQTAPATLRKLILDELVFNPANLQQLAQDGFGNFVLQAIIETTPTPVEFKRLSERIRSVIHGSPYGHKIESKLRSMRFSSNNGHSNGPRRFTGIDISEKENIRPLSMK